MKSDKNNLDDKSADKLQRKCDKLSSELAVKEYKIAVLNAQVNDLRFQIAQRESVGGLFRKLYTKADNKIMNSLTARGQKKVHQRTSFETIILHGDESYVELLSKARTFDNMEFFSYHSKVGKSNLRIQYRVIGKTYRVCRDGSIKVINKTMKTVRRGH